MMDDYSPRSDPTPRREHYRPPVRMFVDDVLPAPRHCQPHRWGRTNGRPKLLLPIMSRTPEKTQKRARRIARTHKTARRG